MLSGYDHLALERMDEAQRQAREAHVARELSAQRRWHRVARYARAAESRHARRLHRAASR